MNTGVPSAVLQEHVPAPQEWTSVAQDGFPLYEDRLLRASDIQRELGVSRATAYRMMADGTLRPIGVLGRPRPRQSAQNLAKQDRRSRVVILTFSQRSESRSATSSQCVSTGTSYLSRRTSRCRPPNLFFTEQRTTTEEHMAAVRDKAGKGFRRRSSRVLQVGLVASSAPKAALLVTYCSGNRYLGFGRSLSEAEPIVVSVVAGLLVIGFGARTLLLQGGLVGRIRRTNLNRSGTGPERGRNDEI